MKLRDTKNPPNMVATSARHEKQGSNRAANQFFSSLLGYFWVSMGIHGSFVLLPMPFATASIASRNMAIISVSKSGGNEWQPPA
jgi:hypothetical protein